MLNVAVVILTFNEEKNISAALDSVEGWASEIFVVDSFSSDSTLQIISARSGSRISVCQHKFDNYGAQWNWAIESLPIKSEWTLKLDADERVTDVFKRELKASSFLANPDVHGVLFRRSFFFMGKRLRFGGVQSNYDLRMWRTGRARFENRSVNEHAIVNGTKVYLKSVIEHRDRKPLSAWLDRHNKYSTLEAINAVKGDIVGEIQPSFFGNAIERRMWARMIYQKLPFAAVWYFAYRYFIRFGFLDGLLGFRYAVLHASYRWWTILKQEEIRQDGISGTDKFVDFDG